MNQFQQPYGAPGAVSVGQMQGGVAPDLTDRNLSVFNDSVSSSGGLMVQFFYHRQPLGGKNARTPGVARYETRLAVAKKPRGDMLTLAVHNITEEDAQRMFPAEWQAFKMHMDAPSNGTPLHELPGATQSMIAILVLGGIRSIEDLVRLPDDVCQNMGMDAFEAQKLAKIWIQRKRGAADDIGLAERLAQLEADRARDQAELQRLRQESSVANQTIEALKSMGIGAAITQQAPHAMGPDVVPAGMPSFGGAQPMRGDDGAAGGGSDIFTITELLNGDMPGMPNPLED